MGFVVIFSLGVIRRFSTGELIPKGYAEGKRFCKPPLSGFLFAMKNFDSVYAVFERSWRYGPDDRMDAEIERISEELCEDEDYIDQFRLDHPGIALDSLEACALYRADAEKVFKERLNAD